MGLSAWEQGRLGDTNQYLLPEHRNNLLLTPMRVCVCVSGDETLRLWDSAHPPHSTASVHAHSGEVLSCDWSKYDQVCLRERVGAGRGVM